ncbi:MAG: transposase [Oligoflexus sp.]|nr:transposase [Oligoflexus sp.]
MCCHQPTEARTFFASNPEAALSETRISQTLLNRYHAAQNKIQTKFLTIHYFTFVFCHRQATFLDQWCFRAMRSKIEPMKKVGKMLRNHRELLLNWFQAKGTVSSGVVEGMNKKVKVTTRKA